MKRFALPVVAGFLLGWVGAEAHLPLEEGSHPCNCDLSGTVFDCGGCSDTDHHHHHQGGGHDQITCSTCALVLSVGGTSHDADPDFGIGFVAESIESLPAAVDGAFAASPRGPPSSDRSIRTRVR